MNLYQNQNVVNYLDKVCAQVKCKEVHYVIKTELLSHLEERVEEFIAKGLAENEAIEQATKHMGDPISVGIQLHNTHKPKIDWKLIFFATLFLGFGLFTLYTIQFNDLLRYDLRVFYNSALYVLFGAVILVLLSNLDYRKYQKISSYIYIVTIAIWVFALIFGRLEAGLPYIIIGPFSVNIAGISPYLLTIALAGLLTKHDWNNRKSLLIIWALFLIPVILYLASPCFSGLLLFTSAFGVLLYLSRAKLYQIALTFILPIIMAVLAVLSQPYRMERFTIFLNPEVDPGGAGYLYIQITEAVKAAGYFGQGFNLSAVPELHTDFVFTYVVYTFGWLAGILLFFAAMAFFIHLFKVVKEVRNQYGSLLIGGLATLLLVQSFWHIFMNLGCLPITGMSLPFISYGGSQVVVQMLILGIILSVYRLKDIVLLNKI